ncbi:MAG: hypothetical protein AAFP02_21930, partial [Bacteroidota bacterium]
MWKSVLRSSLQQLSPAEHNRLRKWVASPYHNADPKMGLLLDAILIRLEDEQLQREDLDLFLYPNQAFNYARITNHLSDLKALLEDFLVWESLRQRPEERKLQLLKAVREKRMDALYQQTERYFARMEQRQVYMMEDDFLIYQLVEEERYIAFTEQDIRALDQSLQRKVAWSERQFVATMLKTACQILNRRNVLQDGTTMPTLQYFLDFVAADPTRFDDWPHLALYRGVLQMLRGESDEDYQALRSLMQQYARQIPPEERKPLYQFAQNHCIKRANQGDQDYLKELFVLYQEMIELEIIYYQ